MDLESVSSRMGHYSPELERAGVLERWSTARLVELLPGTTRGMWSKWAPALVEAGVLARVGRGWIGVAEEIITALPKVLGPTVEAA
jgi:hypothetical protein